MADADKTVPCPHCGEYIPKNAKACKHCGSDERTGWSEDTYLDGVDLPEDLDSYDEIRRKEFPESGEGASILNWKTVVGAALLLAIIAFFIRSAL